MPLKLNTLNESGELSTLLVLYLLIPGAIVNVTKFPKPQVVGVGAANGCTDVGGIVDTDTLDGITGNVTDGSYYVTPSASISGMIAPGDRIRIDGSAEVCRISSTLSMGNKKAYCSLRARCLEITALTIRQCDVLGA